MTDNEVIKALEWLVFNFPKIENPEDDADKMCNCINLYCQNAIEYINRQNEKIERLNVELEFKCDSCENIRLSRGEYRKAILQAKSEAIKEFAERLKIKAMQKYDWNEYVEVDEIDNLVNEMTKGCDE